MPKAAKNQQESTTTMRPKFQQTKLCFASFSAAAAPVTKKVEKPLPAVDYTMVLEKSIKELDIGKNAAVEHPDPCKDCNKSAKRFKCTAIRPNTMEACGLSYCVDCINKKVNEDLEWINSNKDAQFVDNNGDRIQHVQSNSKTKAKWACLVCRGLCNCKLCTEPKQKTPTILLFNIEPEAIRNNSTATAPTSSSNNRKKASTIVNIEPPKLTELKLSYSEEEIWIRLQIREFLFRFADIYGFDNRTLSSLQNVQGDWRIKKFGAYIVWQFLMILYNTTNYELPLQHHEENDDQDVLLLAKKTLNSWIKEKKLHNLYFDKEGKHQALLEVLQSEGMTPKRWQDIAEMLALAEFKNIPVPTSRDITREPKRDEENSDKSDKSDDDDMMEIESDYDEELEQLNSKIKKYKNSTSRSSLIPTRDELIMINMLLELLLFDVQIRQSLVASGKSHTTKEVRDEELEFKKYQKEWKEENTKNVLNRTSLSNRIHQLEATKGKETELKQAQADLDALETLIRDENQNLAKKKLELTIHTLKQEKRMRPVGCDMFGNEYWIFNDILDHLNNATDYRNCEPYWAYGIVIIGPGFDNSSEEEEKENKWWYIKSKDNMKLLRDWIINESKKEQDKENTDELKRISNGINDRIDYLVSLETCVYGEGFFQ